MTQLVIVFIILALSVAYIGYKIYRTIRSGNQLHNGCEGCSLHREGMKDDFLSAGKNVSRSKK